MDKGKFKLGIKKAASSVLLIAIFSVFFVSIPERALAQGYPVIDTAHILKVTQGEVTGEVKKTAAQAFLSAVGIGLTNLLMAAAEQFAYSSAVWVASGGPGETPLFNTDTTEDVFKNAGLAVASVAVDSITSEEVVNGALSGYNVQIDDNKDVLGAIRSGIKGTYLGDQTEDEFNFPDFSGNFQGFLVSTLGGPERSEVKTKRVLSTFSKSFVKNDFAGGLFITASTMGKAQKEAARAEQEAIANDGFEDKVNATSGKVETPASTVQDELDDATDQAQEAPYNIGSSLPDGDTLLAMGGSLVKIFANTLLSELSKKIFDGLFADIDSLSSNPFDGDLANSYSREKAEKAYKSILSFKPITVTDYNLLSKLSTCPTTLLRNSRELYSCAIDTSFASGVSRAESGSALTLKEAIDEGYVNGDWSLIPSTDVARNQDPKCYTYGFCHSNLIKLRKARIIPSGWELAAESESNSESNPVALVEVMNGFNDCNAEGKIDAEHPWCHLVDPNWILKAPETQCRTLAYGQLLLAAGSDSRAEECVDIQTCINEGDGGQCEGGYGYCVREQNIWRFRGDSCPEQFASCLSFENRDGKDVNFLTNTVDFAACDENSVGCIWAATEKRANSEGEFDWPTINNIALADIEEDAFKNRIYVNTRVEDCSAGEVGCSEVLLRTDSNTLNIVNNPSFELNNDSEDRPDIWISEAATEFSVDGEKSRSGSAAVIPGPEGVKQYGLILNQSRFYALSYYIRQKTDGAVSSAIATLELKDEFRQEALNLTSVSAQGACRGTDNKITLESGRQDVVEILGKGGAYNWERIECVFTLPALQDPVAKVNGKLTIRGENVWIDDVQLEQGERVSPYHSGYSSIATTFDYVKLPPSYLGCKGLDSDPEECDNYAQLCNSTDVGCESYRPTNGDPAIFATAAPIDFCPNECVGYDTYKQEPTLYEPNGEFPVHFIPSSAQTCSAAAVGCSEFTRLDNEQREYFTYLRSCVTGEQAENNTDGDNKAVYYTWEGSDTEGFQLRRWDLLASDAQSAVYNPITHESGFIEAKGGLAPCTTPQTLVGGIECFDDKNDDGKIDTVDESCDEHDDIFGNPDCREFYDSTGGIHYRLWSKTITVSDACTAYRKTDLAGVDAPAKQENCELAGGFFDAALNSCRFFGFNRESDVCGAVDNNCREYTGGRSNNSRVAFTDLFEDDLTAWGTLNASNVTTSNESIATDGHSVRSEGAAIWTYAYNRNTECETSGGCASPGPSSLGGSCTVTEGQKTCGTLHNNLFAGKTYTLSFWAKGNGNIAAGFDTGGSSAIDTGLSFIGLLPLTPDWKEYNLGPIDVNELEFTDFGNGTTLAFVPDSGVTFNLDNVVLREGEQNITIIKDSWVTPSTCDVNPVLQLSPQYHLGCAAYSTSSGRQATLRSFSRLCDEGSVGCTAYFSTAQSTGTGGQILNASCSTLNGNPATESTDCYLLSNDVKTAYDEASPKVCTIGVNQQSCLFDLDFALSLGAITTDVQLAHISYGPEVMMVPADTDLYAIVGNRDTCTSGGAGCMEIGVPELSADRSTVEGWKSDYILNSPDNYDEFLCDSEQLYCEEFDAGNNGLYYFREPGNRLCEYKTDVTVGSESFDGWFVEETNNFCYGTGVCSDSDTTCGTDADCRAGAGTCSDGVGSCTQDFDCGPSQVCENTSEATCVINQGTLIKGGDFSGLWRNGDAEYEGWAATCPIEWDRCSEFQDPLDIDDDDFYPETAGRAYNFISNDRLNEDDILSGSKCNGEVSQRLGCTLFNDTGEPGLDFNSSATYALSTHADDILGGQPFDLVQPVRCQVADSSITDISGNSVDLCQQRCVYDRGAVFDITGGGQRTYNVGGILDDRDFPGADKTLDRMYLITGACYSNNDCSIVKSELGENVSGDCLNEVITAGQVFSGAVLDGEASRGVVRVPTPRLENDTNRVLKVDRDRTCSEWLNCSSSSTVWDESTGSYRTVCDDVALCTEYSETGDSSSCSKWDTNDVAEVFDEDVYSNRDITWYGEEYSGYTIPNNFAVQHLEQVDVTPPEDTGYSGPKQFTLGFIAGDCREDFGDVCTVGFCSNDGLACVADDQCSGDGLCVTGSCFVVEEGSVCSLDSDCSTGLTCRSGACVEDLNTDCDIDFECRPLAPDGTPGAVRSDATCFRSVATQDGTCYNDSCVVSVSGDKLDANASEVTECRAQPEKDSPFPNKVVDLWSRFNTTIGKITAGGSTAEEAGPRGIPYSTSSGFENVNLCAPGETCECSYKKVKSSAGVTSFVDIDTRLDDIEKTLVDELPGVNTGELGLCSGGDADGAFCLVASDGIEYGCADVGNQDPAVLSFAGTCNVINREDDAVGLDGYCLERDTGLNINGDQTTGACLTWLPVDQLAGSTDLFAKNVEAGYFEETYMCTQTKLFVDSGTSKTGFKQGEMACAASETPNCDFKTAHTTLFGESEIGSKSCAREAVCPAGFYALVGICAHNDRVTNHYASACIQELFDGGRNECPFVCVPYQGYHANPENPDFQKKCEPPTPQGGNSTEPTIKQMSTYADNAELRKTQVYAIGINAPLDEETVGDSYDAYDKIVDEYKDCLEVGDEVRTDVIDGEDRTVVAERTYEHPCRATGYTLGADDPLGENNRYLTGDRTFDCDEPQAKDNGDGFRNLYMQYNIYPACRELTEVASVDESYAFTDRILNPNSGFAIVDTINEMKYSLGTTPEPFGASSVHPRDVVSPQPPLKISSCFAKPTGAGVLQENSQIYIGGTYSLPTGGDFLSCVAEAVLTPAVAEIRSYLHFDTSRLANSEHEHPPDWPSHTHLDVDEPELQLKNEFWQIPVFEDPSDRFKDRLAQLYANIGFGKRYTWLTGGKRYLERDASESSFNDVRNTGNPPHVYSVDTFNCYNGICREGTRDAITVNGQDSGDHTGSTEFFRATVKFFAAADKNQLPLRRVIVNWGDEKFGAGSYSGSQAVNNYFKNHRGLADDSKTTSLCDTDDEWGMTEESCDSNFFNYQHNYYCDEITLEQLRQTDEFGVDLGQCSDTDGDGQPDNTPCYDPQLGGRCAFRPAVHIRDNWGWCSGVCTGGPDETEGCFENGFDSLNNPSDSVSGAECAYQSWNIQGDINDPWVRYGGTIYIEP